MPQILLTCYKCKVEGLKRKQLKAHIDECPLQVIECPFSSAGCTVKLPRNQMETHEDVATHQHRLVANELKQLKNELNQEPSLSPSTAVCPQYQYKLPPVVFTVSDFNKKKQANETWLSPPFYTHMGGYKVCLEVYADGVEDGEGSHVSIYAYIMRGEHDDELDWPFEGSSTVALLNQKEDKRHCSKTFNFTRYTDEDGTITSCVSDEEEHGVGFRNPKFISHADLSYNPTTNTEYLQDDCL